MRERPHQLVSDQQGELRGGQESEQDEAFRPGPSHEERFPVPHQSGGSQDGGDGVGEGDQQENAPGQAGSLRDGCW